MPGSGGGDRYTTAAPGYEEVIGFRETPALQAESINDSVGSETGFPGPWRTDPRQRAPLGAKATGRASATAAGRARGRREVCGLLGRPGEGQPPPPGLVGIGNRRGWGEAGGSGRCRPGQSSSKNPHRDRDVPRRTGESRLRPRWDQVHEPQGGSEGSTAWGCRVPGAALRHHRVPGPGTHRPNTQRPAQAGRTPSQSEEHARGRRGRGQGSLPKAAGEPQRCVQACLEHATPDGVVGARPLFLDCQIENDRSARLRGSGAER